MAEARGRGYTETLLGRRRYLPELDSNNYRVRQAAERQAMNAGIQGLAADIFKVALVGSTTRSRHGGWQAGSCSRSTTRSSSRRSRSERDEAIALTLAIRWSMRSSFEFPLAVHVAVGDSWAAGKEPALGSRRAIRGGGPPR